MDQHFGIPIHPPIKLVVCNLRLVNTDLVGHNKARLCLASDDQVTEVAIVGLDIALASADREALRLVSMARLCVCVWKY